MCKLYPNWWQYPQFVGCINGCNQPLPPIPVPPPPPPLPVTPPPGSGPPLKPGGYGWYCGPARAADCVRLPGGGWAPAPGQPAPIDALDAACMAHDCCLATRREVLSECLKPKCNPAFCAAMLAMSCGAIYTDPQMLYECQYMKMKALALFCPGPVPPSNTL